MSNISEADETLNLSGYLGNMNAKRKQNTWSRKIGAFDNNRISVIGMDSLLPGELEKLQEFEDENSTFNEEEELSLNKKYKDQFLDYLKVKNFTIMYDIISSNKKLPKDLLVMDEEKIKQFVEPENHEKIPALRKFFIDLDDAQDYDDIDKDIFTRRKNTKDDLATGK